MTSHPLIAAQLDRLRDQLPDDLIEELADGLDETYTTRLALLRNPDDAARAAIEEFGDASTILRAVWRQSPARQHATLLLATGPPAAAAWAAALLTQQAWQWPVPNPLRWLAGAGLLATVAVVLSTWAGCLPYRRRQPALIAATLALLILDFSACAALISYSSASPHIAVLAVAASLLRITTVGAPGLVRLSRLG